MDPIANEAEEIYQRLVSKKSVIGIMVINENGIRTSLDNVTTTEVANGLIPLNDLARRTVRDLDPDNELLFLRIRTLRNEIMVGLDEQNMYIVLQDSRFIRISQEAK
ncbi:dynein light chain roadblock-type 2-like [Uloborus diversus]|uniref:dynein light chain roadblock-type 2-like n=1 Tax=Uloborus diversus TaxID=327109 RepID=UPI0024094CA6|nr:dynein light chain roadblock-type 2-like [Uloborus diversus]